MPAPYQAAMPGGAGRAGAMRALSPRAKVARDCEDGVTGNRPKVSARIRELQGTIAQATIEASIREVNARVAAQQDRWERMQRHRCAGPRPPWWRRAARRGCWYARCGIGRTPSPRNF